MSRRISFMVTFEERDVVVSAVEVRKSYVTHISTATGHTHMETPGECDCKLCQTLHSLAQTCDRYECADVVWPKEKT